MVLEDAAAGRQWLFPLSQDLFRTETTAYGQNDQNGDENAEHADMAALRTLEAPFGH